MQEECNKLSNLLHRIHYGNLRHNREAYKELESYHQSPYGQFLAYILPLRDRKDKKYKRPRGDLVDLIEEDEEYIRSLFVRKKFVACFMHLGLSNLSTVIIGDYFSWWIIVPSAVFVLIGVMFYIKRDKFCNYAMVSKFEGTNPDSYPYAYDHYRNQLEEKCDTMCNILSVSKLLYLCPVSIFSAYLLTMQLIEVQDIGLIVVSSLFVWYILIEIFKATFSKGCEIYSEKHIRDLFPSGRVSDALFFWRENSKDKVEKPTDLLKWYDLRWILMPLVMPKVETYFKELIDELNERDFCPGQVVY